MPLQPVSLLRFGSKDPRQRVLAVAAAAVLFIVLALAIGTLARQALYQMRMLNTANSDNLQWTLSQTEVEFLQFQNAVSQALLQPDADLADVRRWYDIFVSRMQVITKGPIYGTLTASPEIIAEFDMISAFLTDIVPFIDGTDNQLRAHLPQIAAAVTQLRPDVRNLSLEGIRVFSSMSDTQRFSISKTMQRIALLTVSLILLLLLAVFFLARIYRTARLQAAENLATRERLQAMLNTSLDAVLVVNRDGKFVEFNGAATEIFGYTEAEALGADMTKLIFADHMIEAHNAGMQRHLETGETRVINAGRVQMQAKRKSGEVFPVELSVAKTMSPDGEIFVSYLRDISERIQAEDRLTKARDDALAAERAKARFLAVMSHEMRTPLNGLLGSLDLLKVTALSPKQAEFADVMQKSGDLLLHHVNEVLDIARLESGRIADDHMALDLDALVKEVLESQMPLAQAKGLQLNFRPEAGPIGAIMGSAIGLRQVLLNLVNNAIKFTNKGFVEVQASIVTHALPPRLSLRVRDTGIGIAYADQTRVFDDFVTLDSSFGRRADGTGLGLGIARRIIQSMGGEIGVVSQPRLGATFWMDLPYEKAPLGAIQPAPPPAPKPKRLPKVSKKAGTPRGFDVLVVEDNPINRFILREMLLAQGHKVTEAVDGMEGVTLAQERRFDLIFMDISMPILDGIAATVRLRAGTGPCASAPIIALTAHALPEDRALFLASGMNAVLNKPLDRAMLTHVLRELTMPPQSAALVAKPDTAERTSPQKPIRKRSAAAKIPTLPVLRASTMDDLGAALGPDRITGLIARFVAEGDATVASSLSALNTGEFAQAQAQLHSLAGAAATFGALALQAQLAQMEADLKQSRVKQAKAAHPALSQLWQQTKAALSAR